MGLSVGAMNPFGKGRRGLRLQLTRIGGKLIKPRCSSLSIMLRAAKVLRCPEWLYHPQWLQICWVILCRLQSGWFSTTSRNQQISDGWRSRPWHVIASFMEMMLPEMEPWVPLKIRIKKKWPEQLQKSYLIWTLNYFPSLPLYHFETRESCLSVPMTDRHAGNSFGCVRRKISQERWYLWE